LSGPGSWVERVEFFLGFVEVFDVPIVQFKGRWKDNRIGSIAAGLLV
jgi:hypothetical protein